MRDPLHSSVGPSGPGAAHPGQNDGPGAMGQGAAGGPGCPVDNTMGTGAAPPAALRSLVSRVQSAVAAGYLNPQILHQPLAPRTLNSLCQLLGQINYLNQLEQRPRNYRPETVRQKANEVKMIISQMQNQIFVNQTKYMKQQPPPSTGAESRLFGWTLQSPTGSTGGNERDTPGSLATDNAPGAQQVAAVARSQQAGVQQQQQQHSVGSNGNGAAATSKWDHSAGGGLGRGAQDQQESPVSNNQSLAGDSSSSTSGAGSNYNISDIVAEFEPGKPWKGQWHMKSAEDDPHMTPGSVKRNPLISSSGLKESHTSGSGSDQSSSQRSDWNNSTSSGVPESLDSLSNNWFGGENNEMYKRCMERLWNRCSPNFGGNGMHFGNSGTGSAGSAGGRSGLGLGSGHPNSLGGLGGSAVGGTGHPGEKGFLVLKNLTAQIDGSTLKTLCMQHGPLLLFHLFLNHGFALIQYHTREEALKAEAALHNCVLSNTTILAYVPTEAEVNQLLMLGNYKSNKDPNSNGSASGGGQGNTGGAVGQSVQGGPLGQPHQQIAPGSQGTQRVPTSSSGSAPQPMGWPSFDTSASMGGGIGGGLGGMGGGALWGPPEGVGPADSAPLNSFLPGDLLSGESM